MPFTIRTSLSRVGRWPRLLAATACLLLALVSALGSARRAATAPAARTSHGIATVVAAHTLAAGRVLTAHDLAVASWPRGLRPPGAAARVSDRVGARLAGPLAAGEAVTRTRLVGSSLADGLDPGLGAVSVPLTDARAADFVRPGDHVELLSTPRDDLAADVGQYGTTKVVAADVLVLAVLPGDPDDAATGSPPALVVAADRSDTLRLARAGSVGALTAVAVSP